MARKPVEPAGEDRLWKVGELAERAGLTVRTLHHYDAMGLLRPSGRTDSVHGSGHRLYTAVDVARLQQIMSLKQLGFGLEQIRDYMTRVDYDPRQVVQLHLQRVRQQAAELKQLEGRLATLAEALEVTDAVAVEEFLTTIEEITRIEKYYSAEQLELFRIQAGEGRDERVRHGAQEWAELGARVQAAMDAGLDPADPEAQELARQWFRLVNQFTGGDATVLKSLQNLYQNEDRVCGLDVSATWRFMMEYIERAAAAAGITLRGS